jgi:hypothetical protein
MNRRLKWIVIALILVFLGVMIYKYYLAAPAPQQEIDSNVLSAEQEINSGLENKESMWILFVSASCEPCAEMHEIFKQLKPKYSGSFSKSDNKVHFSFTKSSHFVYFSYKGRLLNLFFCAFLVWDQHKSIVLIGFSFFQRPFLRIKGMLHVG